jgi:hypothetical protein
MKEEIMEAGMVWLGIMGLIVVLSAAFVALAMVRRRSRL